MPCWAPRTFLGRLVEEASPICKRLTPLGGPLGRMRCWAPRIFLGRLVEEASGLLVRPPDIPNARSPIGTFVRLPNIPNDRSPIGIHALRSCVGSIGNVNLRFRLDKSDYFGVWGEGPLHTRFCSVCANFLMGAAGSTPALLDTSDFPRQACRRGVSLCKRLTPLGGPLGRMPCWAPLTFLGRLVEEASPIGNRRTALGGPLGRMPCWAPQTFLGRFVEEACPFATGSHP